MKATNFLPSSAFVSSLNRQRTQGHGHAPRTRSAEAAPAVAPRTHADIARQRSNLSLFEGPRRPAPPSRDAHFTRVTDGAAMQPNLARYQAEMTRYREMMAAQDDASSFAPAGEEDVRCYAPEVKAAWDAAGVEETDGVEEAGTVEEDGDVEENGSAEEAGGEPDLHKMLASSAEQMMKGIGDLIAAPFKFLGNLFGF